MNKNYIDLESSVLYRCNQKYYDKVLSEYGIGYSQFVFLTAIFENEGISMNELANGGSYDKGTITKSIAKLEENDYVRIVDSKKDKRAKELYTTQKAMSIMPKLYSIRQEWLNYLSSDLDEESLALYNNAMEKILNKARLYSNTELPIENMKFYGFDKLNLSAYKDKVSAVLYVGACNYRCKNCSRKNLVFLSSDAKTYDANEILEYLYKRNNFLDSVVISGGEPLLNEGLPLFLRSLKETGLKIKLETNGSNYLRLKEIVDGKLVDLVSMSIKNEFSLYPSTIGLSEYDMSEVKDSINYLLKNKCDYEFVMTLSKEAHAKTDFDKLGESLKGAKRLVIRNYIDDENSITRGLTRASDNALEKIKNILEKYVQQVEINK